jgi:subtilase family serine protease
MFDRQKKDRRRTEGLLIEGLESRQLLSGYGNLVLEPNILLGRADSTASEVSGYTPAEIRQAYGFDKISLGSGSVTADGRGQTIAIVDAYNDPNIASDLKTFDTTFGIAAPPSFQVVSQTGTGKLPSTDAGWAGEISLDVEWAHAIAPGANILLVEANSATLDDLMTAVNYARHAPGVSAISMSWGGSEFFSWNNGEFTGETQYDPNFTTPTGHQGITFVAAAGDSGSFGGVQWPAVSPNVLSVGGTSLYTSSNGSYSSESSWNGTSGGYSQIEPQPSYQNIVQTSGVRSTPDVSIVGDPNTGVAVYDSLAYQGYSGWQEVGGTSAGAPIWAAFIAITNQGRVAGGQGTLDGVSQTLPILYSLYTNASYDSNYNDVIDAGSSDPWHWRWGFGISGNQATVGYDTATGLGSPKAATLIDALIGNGNSSSGGSGGSSSGGSGSNSSGSSTPTPAQLPASPLGAIFVSTPPDSVMGGTIGSVRIRITNESGSSFNGPVTVNVYLSTDGSATSGDTLLTTMNIASLKLKSGASKTVKLKFTYPTSLSTDNYFLTASVDATKTDTADATTSTARALSVAQPKVDLATIFSDGPAVSVSPGEHEDATVTVQNVGNVSGVGSLKLDLYASSDGTLNTTVDPLLAEVSRRISLRPGHSMTFKVHFVAPAGQAPGSYKLIAVANSSTQPADTNPNNDSAVAATI